jgi:hypothetical protein
VTVTVMVAMVSAVMATAVVAVMVTVIAVVSRPKPPVTNFAGGHRRAIRGQSCPFSSEAGDRPGVGPGARRRVCVPMHPVYPFPMVPKSLFSLSNTIPHW